MIITITAIIARIVSPIARMLAELSGLAGAVSALAHRRHTYQALASLDDRTLQDIGLNRTMLLSVSIHGTRAWKATTPPSSSTH